MRIVILFLLIALGAVLGGIYGAAYDQVTYSVSSEFFTKFRFPRFHLEESSGRLGAAWVGFLVTWKTGLMIGLVLSLSSLINRDRKLMFRYTLNAFFITLFIAFVTGMIGYSVSPLEGQGVPDPELNITDIASFQTVENMNNFSYAGGVIGMFIGIFYQVYRHKRVKLKQETLSS